MAVSVGVLVGGGVSVGRSVGRAARVGNSGCVGWQALMRKAAAMPIIMPKNCLFMGVLFLSGWIKSMIRSFVVGVQEVYRLRRGGDTGGCRDFTDCAGLSGKLCNREERHAFVLGRIALLLVEGDEGFI